MNPICVVLEHNEPGPKGPMPHGKGLMHHPYQGWIYYFTLTVEVIKKKRAISDKLWHTLHERQSNFE
jgi:hypothetical protein